MGFLDARPGCPHNGPSLVFLPGFGLHSVLSWSVLLLLTWHTHTHPSTSPLQIGAVFHPSASCRWWSFAPVAVFLGTDPWDIYLKATLGSLPLPSVGSLVLLAPSLWDPHC